MEEKLPKKLSFREKVASRFRHGLVLYSLRNFLSRLGLEILPYWLEREGLDQCVEPPIKGNPAEYRVAPMEKEVIAQFFREQNWESSAWEESPLWDQYAYGLYHKSQLAAFMMMRNRGFEYKGKFFKLQDNESYLENMYTFDAFRGKNLAPYLRYKCYEVLAREGRTTCYSVTQYFNTSSLKFKTKLGVRHKALYLHLGLFKRLSGTFKLRNYSNR